MTRNLILTDDHADVLREIGNVAVGHAATALSVLLQDKVSMSVTSARVCEFDEIPEIAGGAEQVIVGVFLSVAGEIEGNIIFLLSLPSARQLCNQLIPDIDSTDVFTDLQISALGEVGNILGGSYINALHMMTSLKITQSVPAVAVDMAGAILDAGIITAGSTYDCAIVVDTVIRQGSLNLDGHFFLLPDPTSVLQLLDALAGSVG